MKVQFNIDKVDAIKNGSEKYGEQTFQFDLSHFDKSELEFLAQCKNGTYESTKDITLLFTHHYCKGDNVLTYNNNITFEQSQDIINTIKSKIKDAQKSYGELAKLEEEWQKLIDDNSQKIIDFINKTDIQELSKKICRFGYFDIDKVFDHLGLKNSLFYKYGESDTKRRYKQEYIEKTCVNKYNEMKELEQKNKQSEIEARKQNEAEKQAKENLLKNWALRYGSLKTKLMLKNDFETWVNAARKDFVQNIIDTRLEGFVIGANDSEPRKNPTLEELQAFDFINELAKNEPSLFDSPQIERVKIEADEDNDYQESYETEIQVKVICLDGSTHWVSKTMQ